MRFPRWFATRGPRPYWLADRWAYVLAGIGAVIVFINTVVAGAAETTSEKEWVNAVVAWLTVLVVFLQGRLPWVRKVAAWRGRIRKEEREDC